MVAAKSSGELMFPDHVSGAIGPKSQANGSYGRVAVNATSASGSGALTAALVVSGVEGGSGAVEG